MRPLDHKAGRELIPAIFLLEPAFTEGHRVCPLHPLRETGQSEVASVQAVFKIIHFVF